MREASRIIQATALLLFAAHLGAQGRLPASPYQNQPPGYPWTNGYNEPGAPPVPSVPIPPQGYGSSKPFNCSYRDYCNPSSPCYHVVPPPGSSGQPQNLICQVAGNGGGNESAGAASFQIVPGTYSVWHRVDPQNLTTPLEPRYVDPATRRIERTVTVTAMKGFTQMTTPSLQNGTEIFTNYRLRQMEVLSGEGADYFLNAVQVAGTWQQMKPILTRVIRTTNPITGAGYAYTVYIGKGPNSALPANPTEFWIPPDKPTEP